MKPPHPTDIRDFALIDQAAYFVASIFLGTGKFDKSEQPTLTEARDVVSRMSHYYHKRSGGRQGMVYAILADGRQVFVPDAYQPKQKESTVKTYSKKSNAQRAARKAGIDLNSIVEASPGQWGWQVKDNGMPAFLKAETIAKLPLARIEGASKKRAPAVKVGKKVKAAKPAKPNGSVRPATGKRAAILADAQAGNLPTPPDFTAETHKRYRDKLGELVVLVKAGDVKGLKTFAINPVSSSPKAMNRYRNLAVVALEAKQA